MFFILFSCKIIKVFLHYFRFIKNIENNKLKALEIYDNILLY